MNKHDLIKAATEQEVAKARGLKQADVQAALDAINTTIEQTLASGEAVQVVGYYSFEPKGSPERNGYYPINKVPKMLNESITAKAKAGQKLKNAVQGLNPKDFMKETEAAAE